MFDGRTGADPYVFYKMFHVERAKKAWMLSDELGLYKALRDGPAALRLARDARRRYGDTPEALFAEALALAAAGDRAAAADVTAGLLARP